MKDFEGHPGTTRLADIISKRIKKEGETAIALDFGEITKNGSLKTNTFPVPIPKGDYMVCRHLDYEIETKKDGKHDGHEDQTETHNTGAHKHTFKTPKLKKGDRVLVAWVQNDPVVVDVIVSS